MSATLTVEPARPWPESPFEEGRRYSYEEYLALEEIAEPRHEFWDGEVIEVPGSASWHSLFITSLIAHLYQRYEHGNILAVGMAVRLSEDPKCVVYPDVLAVGEQPAFEDDSQRVLLNPLLIVEVLAPSTEAADRGKRFRGYRQIPSLQEYVLAEPREQHVELFRRREEGTWTLYTFSGPDAVLDLASVGVQLPLKDLYARLDLGAA